MQGDNEKSNYLQGDVISPATIDGISDNSDDSLSGNLSSPGVIDGRLNNDAKSLIISGAINTLEKMGGDLSLGNQMLGDVGVNALGNALIGTMQYGILRGLRVQLRMNGTMLQYKYEDEDDTKWTDLIDFRNIVDYTNLSYNILKDRPTIDGTIIEGEVEPEFVIPKDALTNSELEEILR